MAIPVFDEAAMKRIVRAVKKVERMQPGLNPPSSRRKGLEPFFMVRGEAVTSVTESDESFELENLVAIGEGAPLPADPLEVANPLGVSASPGDMVYAVYSVNQDVGEEEETFYWEAVQLGTGILTILITETVAAADWADNTLTPTYFQGTRLVSPSGTDAGTGTAPDDLVPGGPIDCYNEYYTQIDVSEGMARIAHVTNSGKLLNVDCNEVEYTPGTGT